MKTTRLKARFVIGYDGRSHVVHHHGELVYRGDTIIYIGPRYDGATDETLDLGLSIISPGFIDLEADIDTDHAHFDIAFAAKPEDAFRMGARYRSSDPYTAEHFRIRQQYSIAQLIRNGITTSMPIEGETFHGWSQSYLEHQIMAEVGLEMGMRLYVGPSFRSFRGTGEEFDAARSRRSLEDALRHFEEFDGKGEGLIRGFINPCQIRFTTAEVLLQALRYAEQKSAPMRLHACEGLAEWAYIQKLGGHSSIEYFEQIGLLSPNLLIPHCIVAKDSELRTLARHGVSVISTPFAEIQGGTALFSFAKYQHYGINMTIGTDAQPVDMIRNMRLARDLDAVCYRRQIFQRYPEEGEPINLFADEPSYPRLTSAAFYNAATVNGAKALGREDIGRLAVGAKADIIAIDLDDIAIGPYEDPIRTMLVSTVGSNVSHTIIDGRMLMKDKQLIDIDEKALMRQAQQVYEFFLNLYEEYDAEHRSRRLFFPPTFSDAE